MLDLPGVAWSSSHAGGYFDGDSAEWEERSRVLFSLAWEVARMTESSSEASPDVSEMDSSS